MVTESESFYEETEQEDPYLKSRSCTAAIQNITTSSEPSESASMVILKELAIKSELRGMPSFITHPKNIEGIQCIAVIDDKEEIFYKAFLEDGKISSSQLTDKEQQYCESLLYNVSVGEKAEYIVMSSRGTMLVTKTLLYPLPDFEKLNQKYFEDTKAVFIKKTEILSILDENRREELISQIEQIDTPKGISSDQIIKILNPDEKKRLKKIIGLSLKFSVRDKASKKMYIGMLGTTFSYDNESGNILYRSGLLLPQRISSGNIRATVKNNSPYRRIIPVQGKIDLDVILPLLDEYFVKYGEITVLPYPVKYAREGWQMTMDSKAEEVK